MGVLKPLLFWGAFLVGYISCMVAFGLICCYKNSNSQTLFTDLAASYINYYQFCLKLILLFVKSKEIFEFIIKRNWALVYCIYHLRIPP